MSDLEQAFKALKGKQADYNQKFAYYDGEQPLTYTASRLKEVFKDLDAYFAENWCSVVIDSAKDRINLRMITVNEPSARDAWEQIWNASELALESDEVHEATMVAGEGFIIAWPDESGQMQAYANDPRMVQVFYEAEFPRVKKYAAKWWQDDDGKMRMTLYYPNRLEYYVSSKSFGDVQDVKALVPAEPASAPNPYGEIPVFHFRLAQRRVKSDLVNVIPLQNGTNKLLTDMMVTAEFQAFPQRFVISNIETQGKLRNSPKEIWDLPAGDGIGQQTQVGQFAAADLKNYLDAIENLAVAISTITRTPKHYFFQIGSNLSGEALIAMEAPLNKKASDRIERFKPVWRQVAVFMLKASGYDITPEQVFPIYDRPETVQPYTQAQTRQLNRTAGLPWQTILREEGRSEYEIEQVMKDIEAEEVKSADLATAYLEEARRNFDQNVDSGQRLAISGQRSGNSGGVQ